MNRKKNRQKSDIQLENHYEVEGQLGKLTTYTKKGKPVTACFDADDLPKVQAIPSWAAQWNKDFNAYMIQGLVEQLVDGEVRYQKPTLHSHILGTSPNAPIRHLNGDLLDNRQSNLDIFDRSQKNEYEVLENEVIAIALKNRYGAVTAKALISSEDLERVVNDQYTWIQQKRSNGQPLVIAHTEAGRLALDRYLTNCPADSYVYHINKNPLDNRRSNLEIKVIESTDANK